MDNYDALEKELIKSINKLSRNKIPKPTKRSKGITSLLKVGKELEEEIKKNNLQNKQDKQNNNLSKDEPVQEQIDYETWLRNMETKLKELRKPVTLVLATGEKFSLEDYQ